MRKTRRKLRLEWKGKYRTKVSSRANDGYQFEVRLQYTWDHQATYDREEFFETVRRSCGRPYRIVAHEGKYGLQTASIFLSSESDLMMLRVADLKGIYKVYQLKAA